MVRRWLPGLILAAILVSFLVYVWWLKPPAHFGHSHDDTIYFSSARALAEGRGYVLPSIPGRPPQTKYPVLYPWLLSWIWRFHPSFPDNLADAGWVTALFSCGFIVAAFLFVRRLTGMGPWQAVVIAGLCAFHPIFLSLSAALLADTLFMALCLTALMAADRGLRKESPLIVAWAAGCLLGLAVICRSLGVALVAASAICAIHRKLYKRGVALVLASSPLVLGYAVWSYAHSSRVPAGNPGWQQTWAYYTSYWSFWKMSVPDAAVFRTMLAVNSRDILTTPAVISFFPPLGGEGSYAGIVFSVTLTAGILAGVCRQARSQEWKPIHFALILTAAIILFWNYAIADRYLMLFLPLFYTGIWIEGKHLWRMAGSAYRSNRAWSEKLVAGALCLATLALAAGAIRFYVGGIRPYLRWRAEERESLVAEKQQAYRWIRENAAPDARFVAYEDAMLYLYTDRQAMLPMAFSNGAFYSSDPHAMQREVAELPDVARQIGANYWLYSEGDFYRESSSVLIRKRLAEWRSMLPVVFSSRQNKVQIYDLSCVIEPGKGACHPAAPALFGGDTSQ